MIKMFAGNYAPEGWMLCNGQALSIAQYPALYTLIGTTYGGDGQQTFNLPDLRCRVVLGTGQGPAANYNLGYTGGAESVTLSPNNLPMHSHQVMQQNITGSISIRVSDNVGQALSGLGNAFATSAGPIGDTSLYPQIFDSTPDFITEQKKMAPQVLDTSNLSLPSYSTSTEGNNQPIPVLQPYLTINHIICVEGLYPVQP